MFSGKHSLTKRIPAGLSSARACASAQRPSREESGGLSPSFILLQKTFLQRTECFWEQRKPLQRWGQQHWISHRAGASVAMLGDLPAGNSSTCFPDHTYHRHSWAAYFSVHFLPVQLHTFLHLPDEKSSPELSKLQTGGFHTQNYLCPTLMETIQDLHFWAAFFSLK